MAYTVSYSFTLFFENINLSGNHREVANKRKDAIVDILKNNLSIIEAFPSGSIPRYTAVRKHCDLDVMVALHYSKHISGKKPSEVLQAVRDVLSEYRTNVRKNGQAVTLYYDTWPSVDIVPCSRVVDSNGNVTHYEIPDMNREVWISTNPKKHSEFMTELNLNQGDSFKKIVKMIKWWNIHHSNFLQSYHIEIMASKIFDYSLGDYSWDIFKFFDGACDLIKTSLWHNLSYVDGYLSQEARKQAQQRLETARDKARDAWHKTYGDNDDDEGAIKLWKQIFGDEFPAYGD